MSLALKVIQSQSPCKMCTIEPKNKSKRINKYTLDIFLERSKEVHPGKFDYSLVTEAHFNGKNPKIPLKCNTCGLIKDYGISNHIHNKRGCTGCNKRLRWNYERFITEALLIHGENFIYHLNPNEPLTANSKVNMNCKRCGYKWAPIVANFIGKRSGCPQCAKVIPWNYERLMSRVREIHGGKYDYSLVPKDVTGALTQIRVICLLCSYIWPCSIDNHINAKSGCPNCVKLAPWTYERLISSAGEIHCGRYDYSEVKPEHITHHKAKFNLSCNKCGHKWPTDIDHHIGRKQGCPICNASRGELFCGDTLRKLGITYYPQFRIDSLPDRRYDFMFIYNNIRYILEYDGKQHFQYVKLYHIDEDDFIQHQLIDILKTQRALDEGYHVIRIDHTQLDNIKYHIERALSLNITTYFSNDAMYKYITSEIIVPIKPKLLTLNIIRS